MSDHDSECSTPAVPGTPSTVINFTGDEIVNELNSSLPQELSLRLSRNRGEKTYKVDRLHGLYVHQKLKQV